MSSAGVDGSCQNERHKLRNGGSFSGQRSEQGKRFQSRYQRGMEDCGLQRGGRRIFHPVHEAMRLLKRAVSYVRKVAKRHHNHNLSERGLLIFEHTSAVIKAELLLKNAGFRIQVKGPPPQVRTGCDLGIEIPLISGLEISRLLEQNGIEALQILSLNDPLLEPVDIFNTKDFGDYIMVRAANMKITVRKTDLLIVNISGGGCPDVPYLAEQLVGKTLHNAPEPKILGSTLCGYALQLAYEELKRRCA